MDGDETYQKTDNSFLMKLSDLEEKQKLIKDRLLLIGENLIEIKQETENSLVGIKKEIQTLKAGMERMLAFLESASSEFSKFARKEDLDILVKQAKMFQLMNLRAE